MQMWSAAATTRRNREFLVANGWGMLLCAPYVRQHRSAIGDWPMALDNGAWPAFQAGRPMLDIDALVSALDYMRGRLRWFVLPDILGKGRQSWRLTMEWLPRLSDPELGTPYAAVQDGMDVGVLDDLPAGVGVFVGGSTEWKELTLARWSEVAHSQGRPCHVARVNTMGRLRRCSAAGVDSVDGSGAAKFLIHAEKMTRWHKENERQPSLFRR